MFCFRIKQNKRQIAEGGGGGGGGALKGSLGGGVPPRPLNPELKNAWDNDPYRQISKTVHEINSELFNFYCTAKKNKIRKKTASTMPVQNISDCYLNKLVVTIPENLHLDENERSVFSKGPSFIPTRPYSDTLSANS